MESESEILRDYNLARDTYHRAHALRRWNEALSAVDGMIEYCPIVEALPALIAMRDEAAEQVRRSKRHRLLNLLASLWSGKAVVRG
jgi:vacuolar-type H+-ATPase catalytic subunit A/Vma1